MSSRPHSIYRYKINRLIHILSSSDTRKQLDLRYLLPGIPVVGPAIRRLNKIVSRATQHSPSDYVQMQKRTYETLAIADAIIPGHIEGDYVVGNWKQHDKWKDYETYLMKYVPVTPPTWIALDFGCGPGRNIRRWSKRFTRIDGVDISQRNLTNAKVFLKGQILESKFPQLFLTEGMDCGKAPRNYYDFAFSTICLQHICVYDVRFSILKSLFKCLKPGGRLSIQMGFGIPSPNTVGYFENFVQASGTNRECDTAISSPKELESDLKKIGFVEFESWIRPTGPGDAHPNWIFATAIKPKK